MTGIKVQQSWNRMRFLFSFFLFAFYLIVGAIFLFTDKWSDLLPKGRHITGIILTLFGILRLYVAYRRYTTKSLKIKETKRLKEENVQP
jgi:hypothetical protein